MFNPYETGQRIRDRRMELKLSQEDFADLMGLTSGFIGLVERGVRFVTAPNLVKISNVLDISTDYILKGTDTKPDLGAYKERLRYLIERVESDEEADFYIELAVILKRHHCSPDDLKQICGAISAFTAYADGRKNIRLK